MKLPLLALLTWAAATAALAGPPSSVDDAALRQLGAAADAAWDARDADRMATYYADDASLLVGGAGGEQHGRAQVQGYYQRAFAGRSGILRHVSEIRSLQMLGPDLALTDVWVRVEARQPDGSWKVVRTFNNVSVAAREADGWKLRAVRAYPVG
jgi:uncharacterized protein (TIGR02246 family)